MEANREKERAERILHNAVAELHTWYKHSIGFQKELKIQGLVGITKDGENSILVDINRRFPIQRVEVSGEHNFVQMTCHKDLAAEMPKIKKMKMEPVECGSEFGIKTTSGDVEQPVQQTTVESCPSQSDIRASEVKLESLPNDVMYDYFEENTNETVNYNIDEPTELLVKQEVVDPIYTGLCMSGASRQGKVFSNLFFLKHYQIVLLWNC